MWILTNLGSLYRDTGRPALQGPVLDEALHLAERLVHNNPKEDYCRESLVHVANEQGIWHVGRGDFARAETRWRQAAAAAEELVRKHPLADDYQDSLACTLHNLGNLLYQQRDRPDEALPHLRQTLAIRERLLKDHPTSEANLTGLGSTSLLMRRLLWHTNHVLEALELHDHLIRSCEANGADAQLHPLTRKLLGHHLHARACLLLQIGQPADALRDLDRAGRVLDDSWQQLLQTERLAAQAYQLIARAEHERAAALARSIVEQSPRDGFPLYLGATILSLNAAAVARNDRLPSVEREPLAERYATHAEQILAQTQRVGYFANDCERVLLERDERLAYVRPRADFQRLLATVKPRSGQKD